jgi:uncharacterized membrane protein
MKKRQMDYEKKIQRQQDIQETLGKIVILSLIAIIIGIPIYNFIVCLIS